MNKEKLIAIAVGASAGGLEALQELLKTFPQMENITMIIAQHLSPTHKSMLVNLLSKDTHYRILEATDGDLMIGGTVYVTPNNKDITIKQGRIVLSDLEPHSISPRPSVDKLFASLGESFKEFSIGIILSGTGHDGAFGAKAIRAEGGIVIAQDPQTAKYDGMPMSVIHEGLADIIIPPYQIGEDIDEIIKYLKGEKDLFPPQDRPDTYRSIMQKIYIEKKVDFSEYKQTTINRRLRRRMSALKVGNIEDYHSLVYSDPHEVDALFKDILIGVTSFFRDTEPFEVLRDFLKEKVEHFEGEEFRIWVAGCSTGEEAYSLGILMSELIGVKPNAPRLQIFATDIDEDSLKIARAGRYTHSSVEGMDDHLRNKYFTYKSDFYTIKKTLRDMMIFCRHDVIQDPPFLKIDLLVCRNLLIYFNVELQNRILQSFHYALKDFGLLFVGKSESLGKYEGFFKSLDNKAKIFRKEVSQLPHNYVFRPNAPMRRLRTVKEPPVPKEKNLLETLVETIGKNFLPMSVVVNDGMELLYSNKENPYFSLPQGVATTNALKMVHKDLTLEFRTIVHRAQKEERAVVGNFIPVKIYENVQKVVRMVSIPMFYDKEQTKLYVVGFQEEDPNIFTGDSISRDNEKSNEVVRLEAELNTNRMHLQTVIEELETSNEELQSLNEELQSSNEELQSTNEELETTNEELQSTNEELSTAYNELKIISDEREALRQEVSLRMQEETARKEILQGVLNASQNGIMAFEAQRDDSGLIVDFTWTISNGAACSLVGKTEEELIGNKLLELMPGNKEEGLFDAYVKVTETGEVFRKEFCYEHEGLDNWFDICAVKYKDGFVVTFADVTREKQFASELMIHQERLNAATKSGIIGVWDLDVTTDTLTWDDTLYEMYGIAKKSELLSYQSWRNKVHPEDLSMTESSLKLAFRQGTDFDCEFRIVPEKGKIRYLKAVASIFRNKKGEAVRATGVNIDVTESRMAAEKLLENERYFHHALDVQDSIVTINDGKTLLEVNQSFFKTFPQYRDLDHFKQEHNCICEMFKEVDHPDYVYDYKDGKRWLEILAENPQKSYQVIMESQGEERTYILKHHLTGDNIKQAPKNIVVFTDITEISAYRDHLEHKVQEEINIRRENEELIIQQSKLAAMGEMVGAIAHQWRQPLNAISMSNSLVQELLEDKLKDKDMNEINAVLSKSAKQISYLSETINDFRHFFTPQTESSLFKVKPVIESSFEFYRHQLRNSGIEMMINFFDDGISVFGQENQLRQVLLNLIHNAKDAIESNREIPKTGKISVNVDKTVKEITISLVDNGGGVDEGLQMKIFEPYFSTKGPANGTGIGLYMSKMIMERIFGGSITVGNENGGAKIVLHFPIP